MIEELRNGSRESFQIELVASRTRRTLICAVWRVRASTGLWELLGTVHEAPSAPSKDDHWQSAHLETIGRMVGGVAHDFNNWVTGVLLQCDLLRSSLPASHPARR